MTTLQGQWVDAPWEAFGWGDDWAWRADMVVRRMERLARNELVRRGRVEPFYIVAVGHDRCYGGPEEGGWWYDTFRVLGVRRVWDVRSGLAAARALMEEHPTCPRGRGSVLGGTDVEICTFRRTSDIPEDDCARPVYS